MSDVVTPRGSGDTVHRVRIAVAVAASAGLVWLLFVREVGPADLLVFLRAARAVSTGITPYADPQSPMLWSGHAFVYPYLTAWPFLPLAVLPGALASALFYAIGVLAVAVAVRLAAGRHIGAVPYAVVISAEPVVRALQLGTLNPLLMLGLAVAWRFRRNAVVVVLALVAVVVAKLFLLPMLAWLLLSGRSRQAVTAAALSAGAVLLGCVLAHYDLATFVRMLSTLSAHEAVHSSSVESRLRLLGASGPVALGVTLALAVAVIAVGRWRAARTGREAWTFSACLAASLVLSPILWSHYFALLLLIPLVLGCRNSTLLITFVVSWMVSAPVGLPALQAAHRFRDAWLVWGVAATVVVVAWAFVQYVRVRRPGHEVAEQR